MHSNAQKTHCFWSRSRMDWNETTLLMGMDMMRVTAELAVWRIMSLVDVL